MWRFLAAGRRPPVDVGVAGVLVVVIALASVFSQRLGGSLREDPTSYLPVGLTDTDRQEIAALRAELALVPGAAGDPSPAQFSDDATTALIEVPLSPADDVDRLSAVVDRAS